MDAPEDTRLDDPPEPLAAADAPSELAQLLGGLHPAVRAHIEQLITLVTAHERHIASLTLRLDLVEAKVDDYLQDGRGTSAREPERQSELLARIGALEQRIDALDPTPEAPSARAARTAAPPTASRPAVTDMDTIRLRLLRAHQRGIGHWKRERATIAEQHALNDGQLNAVWARCQGKHAPDFASRVLRNTPSESDTRVRVRDELAALLGVTTDEIIRWYKLRNGNGTPVSPPPKATRLEKRRV